MVGSGQYWESVCGRPSGAPHRGRAPQGRYVSTEHLLVASAQGALGSPPVCSRRRLHPDRSTGAVDVRGTQRVTILSRGKYQRCSATRATHRGRAQASRPVSAVRGIGASYRFSRVARRTILVLGDRGWARRPSSRGSRSDRGRESRRAPHKRWSRRHRPLVAGSNTGESRTG